MNQIRTSALIGLGALGILFGRKMPGVKVIADAERVARYSAQPVVCNGKECHFDYVTPEQGQPVDLVLVAVKATVLEQAIKDIKKFVGPDTIISVLNGITSEEHIETAYPGRTLWSVAIGMDATRSGRTRIRNVLADKYIDLVGMNTSNGAQAQIWNFVSGGNQEWNLERVDSTVQQTRAKTEEAHDPEPTPSQRKHQNDLVRKLNNAGKGRAGRKA